jgi:hypothetical protein
MKYKQWPVSSPARLRRWIAGDCSGNALDSGEHSRDELTRVGEDLEPAKQLAGVPLSTLCPGSLSCPLARTMQRHIMTGPAKKTARGGRSSERRTGSRWDLSAGQSCLRQEGVRTGLATDRQPKRSSGGACIRVGVSGRSGACEHLPPAQGDGCRCGCGWSVCTPKSMSPLSSSWSLRLNNRWDGSTPCTQGCAQPACALDADRNGPSASSTNATSLESIDWHRERVIIGVRRPSHRERGEQPIPSERGKIPNSEKGQYHDQK